MYIVELGTSWHWVRDGLGTSWSRYKLVLGKSWLGYKLAWYDLVKVRVDWKPGQQEHWLAHMRYLNLWSLGQDNSSLMAQENLLHIAISCKGHSNNFLRSLHLTVYGRI